MFSKYIHIFKSKHAEKRWQKESNRSQKETRLQKTDLHGYDKGRLIFRYNGILEIIPPIMYFFLPLETWTMKEPEQAIKNSVKL